MSLINYNTTGDPVMPGVYACRVPMDECPGLYEDKFLVWSEGDWCHKNSDQTYRGEVTGWIGPLQRKMPKGSTQ